MAVWLIGHNFLLLKQTHNGSTYLFLSIALPPAKFIPAQDIYLLFVAQLSVEFTT
jgi:hypothetical protein